MNNKIKILYLITGLTPGGAELTLKNIIVNLNQDIFEISLCSITNTRDILHLMPKKINAIYFLGAKSFLNTFKAIFKLRKILKKENPDILHCFMFHSNIIGRLAAIGYRCKIISSIRTKLINNKFGNFLDMITQNLVDIYLVNSKTLFEFVNNYGVKNKKIFLIENGVNFKQFTVKRAPEEIKKELNLPDLPIITMVANFKKQKDYPTMIKALAYLNKDIEVCFLALGKGLEFEDETKKVKRLIEKFNLNNVKLLGFREDIPEILSITDVWVSSTLYEGQSNSLLEAMAMKKPIITTDIPENAEVICNFIEGLLIPTRNPMKLAEGIKKLILNKNLKDRLAENAFNKVHEKYNMEQMINKFEELYKILLS